MRSSFKSRSMILAALSTLAFCGFASAQYRVDNSRALDANRRAGSNGFNDPVARYYNSNNWILTGDVTAGRQFRGSLGYTDPRAFRGSLPSATFDNFIRQSSGITTGGEASFNAQVVRPYFGVGQGINRANMLPPGVARDPSQTGLVEDVGGGFVPARPRQFDPADGRIDFGGLDTAKVVAGLNATPSSSALPAAAARYEMLSGTARVRDVNRLDPGGTAFLSEYTSILQPQNLSPVDQRMLDEMRAANTRPPTDRMQADAANADLNGPIGQTLASGAIDQRIDVQPGDATSLETGANITSRALQTGRNLTLDELREEQNRVNQQKKLLTKLPGTDAASTIRDNSAAIRRANENAAAEGDVEEDSFEPQKPMDATKTGATDGQQPSDLAVANPTRAVETPDQAAPEMEVKERQKINYVDVDSFSKGIADAPVSSIVQNAESLMQRQRFASAIVEFDKAEGLSPADPMVQMGRSVAELGGGYYRRAEIYLRRSVETDSAVLLGRYNLRGLLTDTRLDVILNDLKKVAAENPTDAGPLMLLGYVYFNSGAEVRGYEYIQKAKQIGGEDPVIDAMLEAWKIEQ